MSSDKRRHAHTQARRGEGLPKMPPGAKAKAKAKAKAASSSAAPWAVRNDRGRARRAAVKKLNALAEEVGVKTVRLKTDAARVEVLVRALDVRCNVGDQPVRLRAAVEDYPVFNCA